MPTIDNLDIQISSSVNHANASLTTLIKRLDRVSASLSGVNSRGLATMGAGINKLSNAMSNFSANTRTADFTRLARNLTALSTVDTSAFGKMASGIASISNSLSKIPNVSESASKFGELAKGISQLGYKSATQAITNIPRLAVAMRDLMSTLSTAPRVSQNLIDMTNALAKLARTGASSGRATNSLAKSLNVFSASTVRARKSSFSLASAIGKLYATYWLLFRAFGKIGDAIDISSNLTEVQNVVDVTFGKYASLVEKMSQTSIQDFGMSELTVKQVSSRFQAMGTAMGFAQGQMANMSIELTKLTADMASFYNVEQKDVAEDLASIFTGQTRPLRTYGLDLTEATLKEWAMRQGMQANIDTMSQMEKTMLRYQYVLANTGASQGDFARTSETWANQIRILKQQFEQLGIVIGKTFISALKPIVKALNNAMASIIAFAQTVSNSLGKIFGWKYEVGNGGITNDLENGAEFADDIAGGLGDAVDNAQKLKSYLLGIDELNVIEPVDADSISGGVGSGVGGSSAGATGGQWVETESIFKNFESDLDTLYKLGDYIGDKLSDAMENVKWDSVYKKAKNFGKGLANFLNGLISPRLFGNLGSNIAKSLNTALEFLNSFGETFEWEEFGESLATGIKDFFKTFDFEKLSETLNTWVDGLKEAIRGFVKSLTWKDIISGINDFLGTLEIDTVAVIIGAFWIKNTTKNLIKLLTDAIIAKFGTNPINIPTLLISFSKVAFTSPGMIGQLGIYIDQLLQGTFLDTSTWTGLAKTIDDGIYYVIDTVMQGIGNAFLYIFDSLRYVFNSLFNFDVTKGLFDDARKSFEKGGLYIGLGILQGLLGVVNFIVEPIYDFFIALWNEICYVFGIHSPAKNMKPLGEYIFLGIVEGFVGCYSKFTDAITTWWNEYVSPWFTKEQWLTLFGDIKTSLNEKWGETVEDWKTNIKDWWDNNVSPWFTKKRWFSLGENLKNGIYDGFKGLANGVVDILNNVISALESMINLAITGINDLLSMLDVAGLSSYFGLELSIKEITFGRIPQFKTGGFPNSADIFYANENGVPELVGTIGNRTAVASGTEITGISDAIYGTGEVQSGLLQTAVGLLQIIADKDLSLNIGDRDIARANVRGQRSMGYTLITEG